MLRGATAYGWEIPLLRRPRGRDPPRRPGRRLHAGRLDADFAARTLDQLAPFFRGARDCPVGVLVATDADGRWEVGRAGLPARSPSWPRLEPLPSGGLACVA